MTITSREQQGEANEWKFYALVDTISKIVQLNQLPICKFFWKWRIFRC